MKIRVQSIHFTADHKLLDFIQKKMDKLDLFFDVIINGEVYLKLENVDDEANKISEIKINLPGNLLFAKEQCKTFEEATDLAIESLKKQIEKHKVKLRSHESAQKVALLNADELINKF
ncbi:MAG: ribosome hibernation-promoting factor, HPF/YfiA family [Sphingobacteriaceae bacterium]